MGEMAEFFLESQDDFDFYEDCASEGYQVPSYVYRMPTFDDIQSPTGTGKRYFPKQKPTSAPFRQIPDGCWIDKNGELHEIKDMSDRYLDNLIAFFKRNPRLISQNSTTFEQMIVEKCRRMRT